MRPATSGGDGQVMSPDDSICAGDASRVRCESKRDPPLSGGLPGAGVREVESVKTHSSPTPAASLNPRPETATGVPPAAATRLGRAETGVGTSTNEKSAVASEKSTLFVEALTRTSCGGVRGRDAHSARELLVRVHFTCTLSPNLPRVRAASTPSRKGPPRPQIPRIRQTDRARFWPRISGQDS